MKKETGKKLLIIFFSLIVVSSVVGTIAWIFPQSRAQKTKTTKIGGEKIGREVVRFLEDFLASQGQQQKVELLSLEEESGLYKVSFKIGDNQYQAFVSKDGKYFFPQAFDMTRKIPSQTQATNVEKRERPDVKLFVMSYCPFALQMEKSILPVWELLKDKTDIGIYFVDYLMHGKKEMEENLRQYCIQKEEKEKYLVYLGCFVKNGDSDGCLKEAKIDEGKLSSCVRETDEEFKISENFKEEGYPPFDIHKNLNEKYGVKGSPTLVINDTVVSVERSPEKIKETICNAFLNPPSECNQKLSNTISSPGFGANQGSSESGQGQCK
jgi:hypothetical protein